MLVKKFGLTVCTKLSIKRKLGHLPLPCEAWSGEDHHMELLIQSPLLPTLAMRPTRKENEFWIMRGVRRYVSGLHKGLKKDAPLRVLSEVGYVESSAQG